MRPMGRGICVVSCRWDEQTFARMPLVCQVFAPGLVTAARSPSSSSLDSLGGGRIVAGRRFLQVAGDIVGGASPSDGQHPGAVGGSPASVLGGGGW